MDVCTRIKKYREIKGFSQENMAMDLGLSQSQYSRRENGKIEFTINEVQKISIVLGVDLNELLHVPQDNSIQFSDEQMNLDEIKNFFNLFIDVVFQIKKNPDILQKISNDTKIKSI